MNNCTTEDFAFCVLFSDLCHGLQSECGFHVMVIAQEVSVFLRSAREKCVSPPSDMLASCYCSLFCMGKQILLYFSFFPFLMVLFDR